MPINVEWIDETKQIILLELIGGWTWEELYQAGNKIAQMMQSVDHDVDQIIDSRQSGSLPSSAITNLRNASKNLPPNVGTRILVGPSNFYRVMFKMLTSVFPSITDHMQIVETREEAEAILAEKRSATSN